MTSNKKDRAQRAIDEIAILESLKPFQAAVVSTIFVELDLDASDIDIICCYADPADYLSSLSDLFENYDGFQICQNGEVIIANFWFCGFEFEIYATSLEVQQQAAYRHYKIMERLTAEGGPNFKRSIRQLKSQGLKTEPAICEYLHISGNPYEAILEVENWSDAYLLTRLKAVN